MAKIKVDICFTHLFLSEKKKVLFLIGVIEKFLLLMYSFFCEILLLIGNFVMEAVSCILSTFNKQVY